MAVVSDHTGHGVVAVSGTVAVSRGEGASTAVVHQSTANSSFNDSLVADVPPVLMSLSTAMLHLCSIGRLKTITSTPPGQISFLHANNQVHATPCTVVWLQRG